jgi:hypothetical protein
MKKSLCSGLLLVISLGLHAQFDFDYMIENIIIKSVEMIALSPKNKTNSKKTVAPKPLIKGKKYPVKDVSLVWKKKPMNTRPSYRGNPILGIMALPAPMPKCICKTLINLSGLGLPH